LLDVPGPGALGFLEQCHAEGVQRRRCDLRLGLLLEKSRERLLGDALIRVELVVLLSRDGDAHAPAHPPPVPRYAALRLPSHATPCPSSGVIGRRARAPRGSASPASLS